VKRGICSADSIINILLLILGYVCSPYLPPRHQPQLNNSPLQIPGLLHAWYIIAKFPEADYDYQGPVDAEHGRVYVFVHGTHGQVQGQQQHHYHHQGQPKPSGQPQIQSNMNYGTTGAASSSSAPAPRPQNQNDAGEGPSDGPPPPSYAQVVAGDHKVQTQD
jgi:uncharacterized membrane protein YqaE (UPF0057 family)